MTRIQTVIAFTVALAVAPLAVAAQQSGTDGTSAPEQGTASFDQAQIDLFAAAVLEVAAIRDDYADRIQGAESQEAQQELIEAANADMRGAIEGIDGLSVDTYMQIAQAAQDNPQLAARVGERLEAMQ